MPSDDEVTKPAREPRLRTLIVDDNATTRDMIASCLRDRFAIDEAADGAEALERLRTRRYDAVILDISRPGLDGLAILEMLASSDPPLSARVVVVSQRTDQLTRERARKLGAAAFVPKPFTADSICQAIEWLADNDELP